MAARHGRVRLFSFRSFIVRKRPISFFFLLAQKRIMMSFVLKIIVNFEKSAVQETNYLFKNMFQKIVRSKQTIVLFKSFGFFHLVKNVHFFQDLSNNFKSFLFVVFSSVFQERWFFIFSERLKSIIHCSIFS